MSLPVQTLDDLRAEMERYVIDVYRNTGQAVPLRAVSALFSKRLKKHGVFSLREFIQNQLDLFYLASTKNGLGTLLLPRKILDKKQDTV